VTRREPEQPLIEFLAAILRGTPNLHGCLCRGQGELFDEVDDPETVARAIRLCERCPVLDRCTEWVHSLPPSQRPPGVCGGEVNYWASHTSRQRTA
jgi:hypothetical protein